MQLSGLFSDADQYLANNVLSSICIEGLEGLEGLRSQITGESSKQRAPATSTLWLSSVTRASFGSLGRL